MAYGWVLRKAKPLDTKYDPYEMQDEWMAKNGNVSGL